MEMNVVRTYNSENGVVHAQCTFFGCPERTTHIVIGDSHLLRIAGLNMARFQGFEEATKGLVLLHMGGGMTKLKAIVRQLTRGMYHEMQGSFDDVNNTINISLALGYNDVDKPIEEFFHSSLEVLMQMKHILAGVQATWSVHLAEVPYGLAVNHCKTTRINWVACQLNRLLGPAVPLRLWTAQTGLDKTDDELEEVNCENVHIMIEKEMMDPADFTRWHVRPDIMENIRDVIFEWAGGLARNSSTYPPNHTYTLLGEFEISLRQRQVVQDEDYFRLRQDRLKLAYDHPLDRTAVLGATECPPPTMRLQALRDFLQPRPNYGRSRAKNVREWLGSADRGRGGHGRGGRGGGGDTRSAPYKKGHGKSRRGW